MRDACWAGAAVASRDTTKVTATSRATSAQGTAKGRSSPKVSLPTSCQAVIRARVVPMKMPSAATKADSTTKARLTAPDG